MTTKKRNEASTAVLPLRDRLRGDPNLARRVCSVGVLADLKTLIVYLYAPVADGLVPAEFEGHPVVCVVNDPESSEELSRAALDLQRELRNAGNENVVYCGYQLEPTRALIIVVRDDTVTGYPTTYPGYPNQLDVIVEKKVR